jgi:integrase
MNDSKSVEPIQNIHRMALNMPSFLHSNRQICVTPTREMKNLAPKNRWERLMTTQEEAKSPKPTQTSESTPAGMKSKIVEFSFWMFKQGYAESTITSRTKIMKILVKRGANLLDTESVKETIARQKPRWCESRQANAVDAYTSFLVMVNGKWEPPRYKKIQKLPFIPIEAKLDQLIAGCGPKTATLLQLLKETGMRIGEAWNLQWKDIDLINNTVNVTPEKGSNPRLFKLSTKLIAMLNTMYMQRLDNRIFSKLLKSQ